MINEKLSPSSIAFIDQLQNNFDVSQCIVQIVADGANAGNDTFTNNAYVSAALHYVLEVMRVMEKQTDELWKTLQEATNNNVVHLQEGCDIESVKKA